MKDDTTNDLTDQQLQPEFLTVDEAAALLRINRKTLYEAIQRKKVPGVIRLGKVIRISRAAFLAWSQEAPATRRPAPTVVRSTSVQGGPSSWSSNP